MPAPIIRMLGDDDADVLSAHWLRQRVDEVSSNSPTAPYGRNHRFDVRATLDMRRAQWSRSTLETAWGRTWGAWDGDRIIGHVDLRSGAVPTERHRGTVGLAVERDYRRRGLGEALMSTIIDWGRSDPNVAWIDLGVFAHNEAALALYRKVGFTEVATVEDRFRIDGRSVDDVHMVLSVG